MVYVLNMNGKPLMPTERHGKVRRMLRDGKAHVVRLEPFTIQLDYSAEENIQDVSLGIDSGSKHIGVSATTSKRELLTMQVEERDDIVKLMKNSKELFGGFYYENNGDNVQEFDVEIPITIEYEWGKFKQTVTWHIDRTILH